MLGLVLAMGASSLSGQDLRLEYRASNPMLGKVDVTEYGDGRFELCANPSQYADFLYWTIRWYTSDGYTSSATTDTVYSDCLNFDTTGWREDYYEMVFICWYQEKDNLGIGNDVLPARAVIYPNPSSGLFILGEVVPEYILYDGSFMEVLRDYNTQEIDLSNYPPGVYYLRTSGCTYKIIKN